MKHAYLHQYTPPIPALEIFLSLPGTDEKIGPVQSLVDTGADGTLVPVAYLEHLDAPYVDEVRLRSQWGEWRFANVYVLDIDIDGQTLPGIYVVGDNLGEEIILGRNFLNRLRLLLDGPEKFAQLMTKNRVT